MQRQGYPSRDVQASDARRGGRARTSSTSVTGRSSFPNTVVGGASITDHGDPRTNHCPKHPGGAVVFRRQTIRGVVGDWESGNRGRRVNGGVGELGTPYHWGRRTVTASNVGRRYSSQYPNSEVATESTSAGVKQYHWGGRSSARLRPDNNPFTE